MAWISRINKLRDARRSAHSSHHNQNHFPSDDAPTYDINDIHSNYASTTASPSNFSFVSSSISRSGSPRPFITSASSLQEYLPLADAVDPRFFRQSRITPVEVDIEVAQRQHASEVARIETLKSSLENPNLSPNVRRVLTAALHKFERNDQLDQELLPPYSADARPPYTE